MSSRLSTRCDIGLPVMRRVRGLSQDSDDREIVIESVTAGFHRLPSMRTSTLSPSTETVELCTTENLDSEIARHHDAISELKKKFKCEVAHHQRMISKKNEYRNSLQPIARLPPELLSEVFIYYAELVRSKATHLIYPYQWLAITLVCRRWRAIALGTPDLWRIILLTRLPCVDEMLRRSNRLSLDVKSHPFHAEAQSYQRMSTELCRIRSLDLRGSGATMFEYVAQIKGIALPLLQSIIFTNTKMNVTNTPLPMLLTATLKLPSLVNLEITDYKILWDAPILQPTLKHLKVAFSARHNVHRPPISQLSAALKKMPLLQSLEINYILPVASTLPTSCIHLPHLKELRVSDSILACATILDHLSFPTSTAILLCVTSMKRLSQFSVLGASITKKLDGVGATGSVLPLRAFSVSGVVFRRMVEVTHQGYKGSLSLENLRSITPDLSVTFSLLTTNPEMTNTILGGFCRKLPLANVHTFDTGVIPKVDNIEKALLKIFKKTPNLISLGVGGHTAVRLFSSILAPSEHGKDGNRTSSSVTLQNLKMLMLSKVHFDDEHVRLMRICNALKSRATDSNVPGLEELILDRCTNLRTSDINALETALRHSEWGAELRVTHSSIDSTQ